MGHHAEQWDLVIKVKHGDILRRIGAHVHGKLMDHNMNKLRAKIYSLFKFSRGYDLILTYADVDRDIVALDEDDELFDAVICQHLNPLRITVELKSKPGISSTNVQLEPVMDQLMTALSNVFDVVDKALSNSPASEVINSKPFKEVLDNIHKDMKEATSSSPALLKLVDQLCKVARDTGAEVKNKLEKQVEELTWRLQLEKSTRTDMEEEKSQENAKLKVELQNMRQEIAKTKALLIKKEISEKATEEARMLKEVPFFYIELKDKLSVENNELKKLVSSLEKKVDETEKKFEETSRISEERLKHAESQINHMSDSMKRLLDKVSDSKAEDQVLRQPSLLSSPVTSEHLSNPAPITQDFPSSASLDFDKPNIVRQVEAKCSPLHQCVSMVASLSMALSYPTLAATPHMFINAYKNALAVAVVTEYTFPQAEKVKEHLKELEEEEDEDMGFSLFD